MATAVPAPPCSTSAGIRAGPPPSSRSTRPGSAAGPGRGRPPRRLGRRDGVDGRSRRPIVSGRLRYEAIGPADLPGRRRLGGVDAGRRRRHPSSRPSSRAGRRSSASAAEERRTGSSREQVLAANVDVAFLVAGAGRRLQPPAPRALPRGGLVERREPGGGAQQGRPRVTTSTAASSRSRPCAGRPDRRP